MEQATAFGIFFEEKQPETFHENNDKQEGLPQSLPYLQRGDSSKYLDQFFAKNQEPEEAKLSEAIVKKEELPSSSKEDEISQSGNRKFNPSAFHNFQKHLTVCLKHSIQIKPEEKSLSDVERVAAKLWKTFKSSSVSTKKILHYLLGERNQHKITDSGLRQYGMARVYQEAGDKLIKQARNYLASETLHQIKDGKLDDYIDSKKLKDKNKFKKYVQIFVEELQQGFLKKRLPKDKVFDLQNC